VLRAADAQTYRGSVPATALAPVLVVVVIVAIDLWVYADAKRYADHGTPVVFRAGNFVVDTPATWFVGCLILGLIFFPLYIANRT
jgi:hypothetical protein